MTMRRRRPRRFGPRRRTAWSTVTRREIAILPSGNWQQVLLPDTNVPGEQEAIMPLTVLREGFTLVRTLIEGTISVNDVTSVNSGTGWMGIVNINQSVLEAAIYPLPGADEADWMYLGCGYVEQRETVVAGYDPLSMFRFSLDLKSQRRLRSGQDRIIFVGRNDDDSVGSIDMTVCVRSLWKLP